MAETRLKVTYSVTSTTNSTQLFKTSYFSKAELADGTELPSNIFDVGNHAYVFSATGNNDVFYTLTGNTIGDEAFEGMTRIVAVDIPSTVTTLGERCFRNCTNLSSVTLADTVSSFGEGAFDADVALESIVIPSTAVTMNSKVFRGCTGLTSITMSDTTAPAVSADTFYQVQTGGTLYYPTGSTYSNWLSNNQYYLGYYNWNGVETGGTPSGSSVQYLRSQNLSVVSYSMISGASVSDTMPPTEVAGVLCVYAVPYGSNPNIEWTIGHNDLNMSLCGNTVYGSNTDQANNIVTCQHLVTFDSTIEGYTDIAIRETTSNYNVSLRVINRLPGSTASPGVLANPSAVTFSSSGYDGNYYKIADVVCNGFTPDTNSTHGSVFLTTSSPYIPWYGRPATDFVWRDNHYVIRLTRVYENSGSPRESKVLHAFTPNTNVQIISASATTYLFVFGMNQEGSGSTPPTGQTDITELHASQAHSYVMPSSASSFSAGTVGLTFYYLPVDAEIDLEITSSNNNLIYNPHDSSTGITGGGIYSGYAYVHYVFDVNRTNTGSSVITAVDRNTGLEVSRRIYKVTSAATPNLYFSPSAYTFESGASFDYAWPGMVLTDIVEAGCTLDPSKTGDQLGHVAWIVADGNLEWADKSNTLGAYPDSLTKKLQATKIVPNTGDTRWLIGDTVLNDTSGNSYLNSFKIIQEAGSGYTPTPSDRWMYLNPSARTHNAYTDASSNFVIRGSGCSIDSAYTPTFTFSGDTSWISSIERVNYSRLQSAWIVYYKVSRNLGLSAREIYITANGVHDTDGNVYNDLVFHATQNYGSYVFLNYDEDHNAPSGSSVETVEVVPVNTTVCSVLFVSSASNTPDLWTGVTQPTVTVLGNYITVNWPENPYQENRQLQLQFQVVRGEDCEETTSLIYTKRQNAAATPVQKDIKAADTDYSVGSGTGDASTTILTSGCTYDHFTFITGGSFSVTAFSVSNSILFYYPENPTTSPRTGYVYITFYDSDGNTYGPQTITFTQQAGSSPGPGPGPDPETGYVLTTLTISDQEQHRYFVEARPGVVYSAAGQYYKTVLACEARYSLYYVNSYGGVDVLPFKEKSWKKSDTVTRFNYSRSFRNNTLEFENVNYLNSIEEEYELHTGWMTDEQSMRMHELVESTIVYLYDALEKEYIPVVMSDKKLEYKTYHNQGRKFYNYTVNCKASQSRERR